MLKTCPVCSTGFNAPNSGQRRCSKRCEGIDRRGMHTFVISTCQACGVDIKHWPSEPHKTCSPACLKALQSRPKPKRRKRHPATCETCGAPANNSARRFCSRLCYADHLSTIAGPAHHNWRGGLDTVRPDLRKRAWRHLRRAMVIRAERRCSVCGEQKKRLLVHHIVSVQTDPTLALEESNLVVVCQGCHNRIHNPVLSRWRKYHQKLVTPTGFSAAQTAIAAASTES